MIKREGERRKKGKRQIGGKGERAQRVGAEDDLCKQEKIILGVAAYMLLLLSTADVFVIFLSRRNRWGSVIAVYIQLYNIYVWKHNRNI